MTYAIDVQLYKPTAIVLEASVLNASLPQYLKSASAIL